MLRAFIKVLVLLAVMVYLSLFLSWNWGEQPVTSWELLGWRYTQNLPLGVLCIVGLFVGAVVMGLFLMSSWNAMKATEKQLRELIERAKVKVRSQDEKIKQLMAEVEQAQLAPVASGPSPLSSEEGAAGPKAKSPVEDPEVV